MLWFGVSCGFIDFTFVLLLKIHLRLQDSFLRFHYVHSVADGTQSDITMHSKSYRVALLSIWTAAISDEIQAVDAKTHITRSSANAKRTARPLQKY